MRRRCFSVAHILNFGSLNIDYVYRVDAFVRPGETKSSRSLIVNCGGKGLNQSIAAARAGASVYHAGLIGRDGDMLYQKLLESGVNLSLTERAEGVSGHAIIQVDDAGQNCILLYGGTNRALTLDYVERALDAFGTDGLVLLQNETNLVGEIISLVRARGLAVALNAAPANADARAYPLHELDYLIVNELEGAFLAGCEREEDILPALRNAYPKLSVLLTLGKRGSIYAGGGAEARCGAYRVQAVDTTAAGDTFSGYFLTALLDGSSARQALELATAAAALCVRRLGAADSVPNRAETLAAIDSGELGTLAEWGGWR